MIDSKMGVSYQITQYNQDHQVVATTPEFENAILNNSTMFVSSGFTSEPKITLGKSAIDINNIQEGVVDPVREFDYKLIETARFVMAQPLTNGMRYNWISTHEFKYTGDDDIILHEIGIDNFSRAIIVDIALNKFPIYLRKGDYLRIQMTFAMVIRTRLTPTVIDDQGGENSTKSREYRATFSSAALPNQWWKLLAGSTAKIVSNVKSYNPIETRNGVVINRGFQKIYKFTTDEVIVNGFILSNTLMGDYMTYTFVQPVNHFGLQDFELTVNHTW